MIKSHQRPRAGRYRFAGLLSLSFLLACQISLAQSVPGIAKDIGVMIPMRDGQKIRLRGKGNPGPGGNGDLILTVTVEPHPLFGRDGDNLTVTLPVTFPEAALGARIEVPTFDGSTVTVKLPAGTPSGRILRVKGKGVRRKDGSAGDLLVNISVAVPQKLDGAAKEAVEAYAKATAEDNPRVGLFAQARQA